MPAARTALRTALLGVLALALLGAACKKEETAAPVPAADGSPATSEPTQEPTGAPEGEVTVGDAAELPDDFPGEFALPDDAVPVYSYSDQSSMFVWFSSAQSGDELAGFFDDALGGGGWTVVNEYEMDSPQGMIVTRQFEGNGWEGILVIGESQDTAGPFEGDFAFYVNLWPAGG